MSNASPRSYLKIAVSAISFVACVLLIALWVRSNYWYDDFGIPLWNPYTLKVGSMQGLSIWYVYELQIIHYWDWNNTKIADTDSRGYDATVRDLHWIHMGTIDPVATVLPHWLLVLLTAALALSPWIKQRFSLRTLLIVVTLIAVFLGLIAILR